MNNSWVYTLADVLQMPLIPQPDGRFKGAIAIEVADADIKFHLDVVDSHTNGNELGLLLKVDSKLYFYVTYTHGTRLVEIFFINGEELSTVPQKGFFAINCNRTQVITKLGKAVVKSYYRNKDKVKWINH